MCVNSFLEDRVFYIFTIPNPSHNKCFFFFLFTMLSSFKYSEENKVYFLDFLSSVQKVCTFHRIRSILKSKLNGDNVVAAINERAVSVS